MGVFSSFLFIGSGGSALLNSFQGAHSLAYLLSLTRSPDFWGSPVSNVPEEDQ